MSMRTVMTRPASSPTSKIAPTRFGLVRTLPSSIAMRNKVAEISIVDAALVP